MATKVTIHYSFTAGRELMGALDREECKKSHHSIDFTRMVNVNKEDVLKQHERLEDWKTDNTGLILDCKVSMSIEDKRAQTVMESSAKLLDGHYQLAKGKCLTFLTSRSCRNVD